jgi:hypothetical protein
MRSAQAPAPAVGSWGGAAIHFLRSRRTTSTPAPKAEAMREPNPNLLSSLIFALSPIAKPRDKNGLKLHSHLLYSLVKSQLL